MTSEETTPAATDAVAIVDDAVAAADVAASADAADEAAVADAAAVVDSVAPDDTDDSGSPSSAEYTVAFSPRQVAVGFAIVAGLVAIAISRRRRGRKPTSD
jgi:hypothetical protein